MWDGFVEDSELTDKGLDWAMAAIDQPDFESKLKGCPEVVAQLIREAWGVTSTVLVAGWSADKSKAG